MFSMATKERPALYFTVLGESPLMMLRYQQQFSFFDPGKINKVIRFVNLEDDVENERFDQISARIMKEVGAHSPGLVFVDSFRSIMSETDHSSGNAIGPQNSSRNSVTNSEVGRLPHFFWANTLSMAITHRFLPWLMACFPCSKVSPGTPW